MVTDFAPAEYVIVRVNVSISCVASLPMPPKRATSIVPVTVTSTAVPQATLRYASGNVIPSSWKTARIGPEAVENGMRIAAARAATASASSRVM
jgi:hypothetical protein